MCGVLISYGGRRPYFVLSLVEGLLRPFLSVWFLWRLAYRRLRRKMRRIYRRNRGRQHMVYNQEFLSASMSVNATNCQ